MNRMPEVEHFPACNFYGLGIVPYSPLARGVLTGKYRPDAPPDKDTRAGRNDKRMMQTEWRPESLRLAQQIRRHAEASGITAGQFAVSWVLNSSFVSGGIAGPRTEEQWDDYLRALDYRFTAEDEALIDRLVASGHPSTPGFNDPAYPIEGRRARTAGGSKAGYWRPAGLIHGFFTSPPITRRILLFRDNRNIESGLNDLRRAMPNRSDQDLRLDHTHCRAICDEIGERLRDVLKREASKTPPRLLELIDQLAELEAAPSIVPSIDDMCFPLEHDPDKWKPVFPKRSCSNKKINARV